MSGELLTLTNPKLTKGEKLGYRTAVLHLAPHTLSGFNVCPSATAGCSAACLNTAGRGGLGLVAGDAAKTNSIQEARKRRTLLYFNDRPAFMSRLILELERFFERCRLEGFKPAVRLNGTSDIRWENVPAGDARNVMSLWPNVPFYDYTKLPNRRNLPANYSLTFSLAETAANWRAHLVAFKNGLNVAVVFSGAGISRYPKPFPETWRGRRLIDGDLSDLRFLDPAGVYVGLRAKGRAQADSTGFVRNLEGVTL